MLNILVCRIRWADKSPYRTLPGNEKTLKETIVIKSVVAFVVVLLAAGPLTATCTPTGYIRDSINMTAALINPVGTVSGDVDATGCNVGVYYDHGMGVVYKAN